MIKANRKYVIDVEAFPNWFCLGVNSLDGDRLVYFDQVGDDRCFTTEDRKRIERLMRNRITIGFNSYTYDLPLIYALLDGKTCGQLHELSNAHHQSYFAA